MFTVYILYSRKYKKNYTGFTSNLEQRIKSHNKIATKGWTVKFRPWEIIHTEVFETKAEAVAREKYLKTGVGRDFIKQLIHKLNA